MLGSIGFGILLGLLLTGCATVPLAPTGADSQAKTFATKRVLIPIARLLSTFHDSFCCA
jgi:hypothetical protein